MFFIVKTPLGEYRSSDFSKLEDFNAIKKVLKFELPKLEYLYFDCQLPGTGEIVQVCLPKNVIQNSVFITVE